MKNIILIGSFGSSNIGDEAILESMLLFLRESLPDSPIHILSGNPQDTEHRYKEQYNISASRGLPFGLRSIIRHGKEFFMNIPIFRKTTHVIFPGGGLWTDHESLYAVLLWSIHVFFFGIVLQKPVFLVGQSIGPLQGRIARTISTFILRHCNKILVRDEPSLRALTELGVQEKSISRMHDMVCYMPCPSHTKVLQENVLHIAISLRPWNKTAALQEELMTYLEKRHKTSPIHLHFIPMQYHGSDDVSYLKAMAHACDKRHIPYTEHYPTQYKDVLRILHSCHYAIGMRLHFLIVATLSHTPFFALSYSSKVLGFLKDIPSKHYYLMDQPLSALHTQLDHFFHEDPRVCTNALKEFTDACQKEKAMDLRPLLQFLE